MPDPIDTDEVLAMIKQAVAHIEAVSGDDESARSEEDGLHQDVLQRIADHAPEPFASWAAEALRTRAVGFARWCA